MFVSGAAARAAGEHGGRPGGQHGLDEAAVDVRSALQEAGSAPRREHEAFDATPTLANAPEGLSARRVERWLDLPLGAWQKRRLYALKLRGDSFAYLGLRPGDYVIVEPGSSEQPGRIVVTRGPQGLALRRIAQPHHGGDRHLPTVLELPLREKISSRSERVVGSVIGQLRSTGTGALRPIVIAGSRRRRPLRSGAPGHIRDAASLAGCAPSPPCEAPAVEPGDLEKVRLRWRSWLDRRHGDGQDAVAGAAYDRLERLDASLATLCDCLARTHSPGLRAALAEEADAVVSAIEQEMGG
ncbi:MAG TPA: S24 family peptidase [Candidatus Binatia bacterium]|jgi:hypothetical protein